MTAGRLLASLYFLAVVGYVTWGTVEGRGLPGHLTGWMLQRFGVAWDEVASGLSALALLTPLLPFRGRLGLDRTSSKAEMALLYGLLLLSPALVGWMGRDYLIARDAQETALPLESFQLGAQPLPLLTSGPHLVRLQGGYLPAQTQHTVREDYGETHQLYIPFAESAEASTVGFVLVMEQRGSAPALLWTPGSPPPDPEAEFQPATLEGVAEAGTVPVYVEEAWREAGLELASPYYLVQARTLVDDRLPSRLGSLHPEWALYLGLLLSAMMSLGLGLGWLLRRSRRG